MIVVSIYASKRGEIAMKPAVHFGYISSDEGFEVFKNFPVKAIHQSHMRGGEARSKRGHRVLLTWWRRAAFCVLI